MATSTQLRSWWSAYRCDTSKMVRVSFPGSGRTWDLLVAKEAVPAWELFADLMIKHGYLFRESAGGTYVCRKIAGTDQYSLHSYGTAIDLNPSKNPFKKPLTHDYPQAFISDVLSQKAKDGTSLFRWGGSWSTPDAMHWEVNCAPSQIPSYTSQPGEGEYEMKKGDKGLAVAEVQHALDHRWGYDNGTWAPFKNSSGQVMKSQYDGKAFVAGTDGDFGSTLEANIKKFQAAQNLPVTGIVDGITHSMIFGRYGIDSVSAGLTKAEADSLYASKATLATHIADVKTSTPHS